MNSLILQAIKAILDSFFNSIFTDLKKKISMWISYYNNLIVKIDMFQPHYKIIKILGFPSIMYLLFLNNFLINDIKFF